MNMHISKEHKLKYLNRRMTEIEELRKCVVDNDYEIAVNIGHRLKGNGETFGFPIVSKLGETIENTALLKDKKELHETIEKLATNVEELLKLMHIFND